ncbi:MAG TPA: hypothetical protein VKN76_15365 [Kiloniellaceae bacterium]|nr:hypothetical protein [Kiloniellaceae bacterium]
MAVAMALRQDDIAAAKVAGSGASAFAAFENAGKALKAESWASSSFEKSRSAASAVT